MPNSNQPLLFDRWDDENPETQPEANVQEKRVKLVSASEVSPRSQEALPEPGASEPDLREAAPREAELEPQGVRETELSVATSSLAATGENALDSKTTEVIKTTGSTSDPHCPPANLARPDLAGQLVIVVDSHSLIYQVFHALPPMSSPTGEQVGAVHGFLLDILELKSRFQPAFLFCAFDKSEVTFRNELYEPYKAHRDPMPDELRHQIGMIRDALPDFGVNVLECGGFEADDILATIARQVDASGGRCLLITSDKDCRQLITDRVQIYNIRKHEIFGADQLQAVWGIAPGQVVDFQAMVGDSVDNIPGIPLIGPKLAQELLQKYGTLDSILDHAHEVAGPKRRENILNGREQAMLSRQLARLRDDAPCALDWGRASPAAANPAKIAERCQQWGLRRLRDRANEVLGQHASQTLSGAASEQWDASYRLATTTDQLREVAEACRSSGCISLDTETTGTNARGSDLVGISLAWGRGQAAYIPVRAPAGEVTATLSDIQQILGPVFADPAIAKVGQNIKFDLIVLRGIDLEVQGIVLDTMIADYLLDPGQRNHSLDELAKRYLGHQAIPISDLIGTGRQQKRMDQVPLPLICEYACEDADVPWRLKELLLEKLAAEGLAELFREVELPVIEVLADLEFTGIHVDVERLQSLSGRFGEKAQELHEEITALAGAPFNLDSPKQLAEVLFERLKLRVVKKTKTGASTDAEVLQELAADHPLPRLLLQYRQLTKLKNTYVDSLPHLVNAKTGRVHTSFRQDVAATGRLSSTEPNLQNIPIRTEEGRAIRSAFLPGYPGWILLAADYSQIELRVLAHYCQDPALLDAYERDQDIHARVAAEVFQVAETDVTAEMRRTAKTINFGIIYGQSPYGLAKTLGIDKEKAAEFIKAYFARYPGVKQFMQDILVSCREKGYVQTMLGRKRKVQGVRDFGKLSEDRQLTLLEPERIAVNTVIQGSAADLIKLAMIRTQRRLKASGLQAKMLLQIHDELVFETEGANREALADLVRTEMIAAAQLRVPLKVEIKTGPTWEHCEA